MAVPKQLMSGCPYSSAGREDNCRQYNEHKAACYSRHCCEDYPARVLTKILCYIYIWNINIETVGEMYSIEEMSNTVNSCSYTNEDGYNDVYKATSVQAFPGGSVDVFRTPYQ